MEPNRRFGLSGKARYRLLSVLSFPAFIGVVFGGEHRWIGWVAFAGLLVWGLLIDPLAPDGSRAFLGLKSDRARKFGIGSVFGRKPDE